MNAPRIGVLGARRARQGLGPFVARDLVAAGAQVVALATTSRESAAEARAAFLAQGVDAQAHSDPRELLARGDLDAVALLSPAGTHGTWLAACLERGLHVLCEKPLLASPPSTTGEGDGARATQLVAAFAERGLLLRENCQYPVLLDAYRELCPEALAGQPRRFAMELAPEGAGDALLREGLPHALSLVQAVLPPDARLEHLVWESVPGPMGPGLEGRFDAVASGAVRLACRVRLVPSDARPRPAAFGFGDQVARRAVDPDSYAFQLVHGERRVACPDPLTVHLGHFVQELRGVLAGGIAGPDPRIPSRAVMLEQARAALARCTP